MIFLFTDFGAAGPYTGQMKAVLRDKARRTPVIDLVNDAPAFDVRASSYLLAALLRYLPWGSILLGVVDPGVGGPRRPVIVRADGCWLVGPDNGLFEIALRHADDAALYEINGDKEPASATFHGRDVFAPAAAELAQHLQDGGSGAPDTAAPVDGRTETGWPDQLAEVIYIDHYGNAMTGLEARDFDAGGLILPDGTVLDRGRRFGDVPVGRGLFYENSIGLIEIAVNRARADTTLGLSIGDPVRKAG